MLVFLKIKVKVAKIHKESIQKKDMKKLKKILIFILKKMKIKQFLKFLEMILKD